jgi:NosR/NirI family nitrous oxide reductase transcriptional regulator
MQTRLHSTSGRAARTLVRAARTLLLAAAALASGGAAAGTYDVTLPPQLSSDPDLCAYAPCRDVLPAAERFSVRKGQPPYVEGYATGSDKPVGYVFLSTDVVDIPAYSGKPVVTLIGMDAAGRIAGVRILKHSEPILLVGIPESELTRFVHQFVGRSVSDRLQVGSAGESGAVGIDAISGATVTVIAEIQVVMRSAHEIARQVGLVQAVRRPQAAYTDAGPRDWAALMDEGRIEHLVIQPGDLGLPDSGQPYIDLYFGLLDAPAIGRSMLGDQNYARLLADLKPGEHALFIVSTGTGSFKGSGFVRGGIFDRIQVRQGEDSFTFRDTDYQNLYDIGAAGAPAFRESGIFIIRGPGFSAAYPWSLVFLAHRVDRETGAKTFASFERESWLPAGDLEGGRPRVQRPTPAWLTIWKGRAAAIAAFIGLLAATAVVYALRDTLARRSTRKDKRWISIPRYLIWAASIGFVGAFALAQPSITQVLTWFHSLVFQWRWELFLSDPLIFIFWWFIIASVFVWGRGVFCGWLCPYGSLSELVHKVGGALGLKRWQFKLPLAWHDRLKWIKYGIFAGLLAVSFYSMPLAEKMAEVEPFKSTFLVGGVWHRAWPFVAYWGVLLVLALFIERPFCKYLCPLGAALAVPTTFRNLGLLRKPECTSCRACQKGCTSLAIDDAGRIDQRECLLCLDCQVLYYDDHACPPLVHERKRRGDAGLALTPIGRDGYFIPIVPLGAPAGHAARTAAAARPAPAPRAGGAAAVPGSTDAAAAAPHRLWEEIKFHLLPWGPSFPRTRAMLRAAELGLAAVVTLAWLLSGAGQLGAAAVAAWWGGWSVYEVAARRSYLPWIKEGPWWGRDFRPASLGDLMAYVATKNLLIGATLFVVLHSAGVLNLLRAMPSLRGLY